MECLMARHTVTKARKDHTGTPIESDSRLQIRSHNHHCIPLLSVRQTQKRDWTRTSHVCVVTSTDLEVIVENHQAKLSNNLQYQMLNSFESTFEDTLRVSYFNLSNGLVSAVLNVVELLLSEVVQCGRPLQCPRPIFAALSIPNLQQTPSSCQYCPTRDPSSWPCKLLKWSWTKLRWIPPTWYGRSLKDNYWYQAIDRALAAQSDDAFKNTVQLQVTWRTIRSHRHRCSSTLHNCREGSIKNGRY